MALIVQCLAAVLSLVQAEETRDEPSLEDALIRGRPSLSLRLRYEHVNDAGFAEDAHASTLRTTLSYRTLPYRGWSFFLQAQNVANVGNETFNNLGSGALANEVRDRPVVADPSHTRFQQAYSRYHAFSTTVDVGRRELALGDQRFVGDVGWRQNHQAFDTIVVEGRAFEGFGLTYAFVGRVVRIFGDTKDMSSHLVNARAGLGELGDAEVFAYLLDYEHEVDEHLSTQTYGGKLTGRFPLSEQFRLLYEAQYARQWDHAENPDRHDANYGHLIGGLELHAVRIQFGREVLSASADEGAFQTPLATGHKFNGWADRFLVTPEGGLVDTYLSVSGTVRSLGLSAMYHWFRASSSSSASSYGSELDVQVVLSTQWKQAFGAKLARYRADGFSSDITKVWVWTQYGF